MFDYSDETCVRFCHVGYNFLYARFHIVIIHFLFAEIALSSSELFNNVTLALYLYQRLVPTLLAQASINITKLFTESINTCNKFGVSPNCVQTTLDMLLEAPVGSLQGVLKVS